MRVAVSRALGAERVVTPLELLFDLVRVFAVGELSHHLLEHVELRTGAETVERFRSSASINRPQAESEQRAVPRAQAGACPAAPKPV